MAGMAEVGRLFNNNELIVAEVLQSAEAMKAAVSHLEQFMEKADTEKRAKVIFATVKGDVHDIGKNLVEIILKNNGYDVINLGIKVPPEDLIRAHREHKPDAIGLSGLLVKSAQQMVITAARSARGGNSRAVARWRRGAFRKIHATQNRSAVQHCRLLRQRRHDRPAPHERTQRSRAARGRAAGEHFTRHRRLSKKPRPVRRRCRRRSLARSSHGYCRFPPVAYLDRKVRAVPDLNEIWSYINPYMLFGRHLGFRGNFEKALAERDARALELFNDMEEIKREATKFMKIGAVWQFFEAERQGNSIALFAPGGDRPDSRFSISAPARR